MLISLKLNYNFNAILSKIPVCMRACMRVCVCLCFEKWILKFIWKSKILRNGQIKYEEQKSWGPTLPDIKT